MVVMVMGWFVDGCELDGWMRGGEWEGVFRLMVLGFGFCSFDVSDRKS